MKGIRECVWKEGISRKDAKTLRGIRMEGMKGSDIDAVLTQNSIILIGNNY